MNLCASSVWCMVAKHLGKLKQPLSLAEMTTFLELFVGKSGLSAAVQRKCGLVSSLADAAPMKRRAQLLTCAIQLTSNV